MQVPSIVIAMQLRNAANVLDAVAKDQRLQPATANAVRSVAESNRETAKMIEHLPPFVADNP